MRITIPVFFTLLMAVAGCKVNEKPNVVLFVADDLGWTDLTCYGSRFYQTPNIDMLASEGMMFTNGYSACTVCSPTRASIMTGKYPGRLHLTNFIPGHDRPFARFLPPPEWKQYLDLNEYTLAEALKDNGYLTIHLGKWHLGKDEIYWPENQGFDINIGGGTIKPGKNGVYFTPYGNPRLSDGPEGEYLTERLASEAVSFIKNRKEGDKPFFMNFWFFNPHTPLQAKEEKIKKYEGLANSAKNQHNPIYAAMIEHLDEAVGKVMMALKEAGVDNNTIVLFTSDNGGLIMQKNFSHVTSNIPLKSGKGDMFEGGVRVPFIVRWNKKIKANTVNHTPVISCDIYPTILGLSKSMDNEDHNARFDGKDISGLLLKDQPLSREALYWHFPHYHPGGAEPYSAIRKGKWKLIEAFGADNPMLFNLENDIGEKNDVAAEYPQIKEELLADLNSWRKKHGVQYPVVNPAYIPEFQGEFLPPWLRGKGNEEFLKWLRQGNEW